MTYMRALLFFVSTLGTFEFLRLAGKERINGFFLPSLTVAAQVTALFFGGLLNVLPETVLALYLLGFLGLAYRIRRDGNLAFLQKYRQPGYGVFLAVLLLAAVYVHGKVLVHYDNFTHWGQVVRTMLDRNQFPNFEDTLVEFQEYPLGSSVYLYFFARCVGTGEPVLMLAQIYMLAAAVLPLFALAGERQWAAAAAVVPFFYVVFVYNIFLTDLLVDTLLPIVGMCGLLFALLHCKKGCGKLELWCSALYMTQVIQIKNSGVFFAILIALPVLRCVWQGKAFARGIPSLVFPFFSMLLWQRHCRMAFSTAEVTLHAMTLANYRTGAAERTAEDLLAICKTFLRFAVTWKDVWLTAAFCVVIGCLILAFGKEERKRFLPLVLFSLGLYVVYQLGLLAMYLFSMPVGESMRLASAKRYTRTILIAILYLNMIPAVQLISGLRGKRSRRAAVAGCVCLSLAAFVSLSAGSVKLTTSQTGDPARRIWMEQAREEYNVPDRESYCVLLGTMDNGYMGYMTKYMFQSSYVGVLTAEELSEEKEIIQDYIFVYDSENPTISEWIRVHYPEQAGRRVIITAAADAPDAR